MVTSWTRQRTPIGKAKPSPGDFTICIQCISILCFDDDMKLRTTTLEDRADLPDHAIALIEALAMMKTSRR